MSTSPTFREVMEPFAAAISPLASALAGLPKHRSTRRTALLGAIRQLVYKGHDAVLDDLRRPSASVQARRLADEHGEDLATLPVPDIRKRLGELIILEHTTPVGMQTKQFELNPEPSEILDVLDRDLHGAWITRVESKLLNSGHKSHRPNPREIFRALGIEVDPWPGNPVLDDAMVRRLVDEGRRQGVD